MQKKNSWIKPFITIYTGQAFSILGSAAVQFAIIWWLTETTESAMTLMIATLVGFVPNMVFGLFAGVWIDRYNRRTVMMLADGVVALSSVLLGIVFLITPNPPLIFVYFILFLRGLGSTFHSPAMQAAIPTLVPVDMLERAGGWGNLISSLSTMLGPALGAMLMTFMPIASIMLVDILGAAFAIISLLFVTIPDIEQSAEKPQFLADIKLGFQTIWENKPFMALFPAMLLTNIIFMPLGTLYPLLVRTHFLGSAWHNGVVEVVFSLGMLISSLIMGIWGGMRRRFLMVSLAMALLGATSVVSGLLPPSLFWIFVVCSFFMGTTGTFLNVPVIAYAQEVVPADRLGKVLSLVTTVMTWAMPLGLFVAAPISEAIGVDKWFFYSGIALMLTAVLCRAFTKKYDAVTMKPGQQ